MNNQGSAHFACVMLCICSAASVAPGLMALGRLVGRMYVYAFSLRPSGTIGENCALFAIAAASFMIAGAFLSLIEGVSEC